MLLKKGTVIYPSHIGYYNFHYPDIDKKFELMMDTTVKDLPWASYDNFIATEVISPKEYLPYVILWIEKPA